MVKQKVCISLHDNISGTHLNPCQLVEIDVVICQIYWGSQVVFSILFLVWNLLVAVVLVSVARTQVLKPMI